MTHEDQPVDAFESFLLALVAVGLAGVIWIIRPVIRDLLGRLF